MVLVHSNKIVSLNLTYGLRVKYFEEALKENLQLMFEDYEDDFPLFC